MRSLKPTVFGDLIAMNALYRPGPMEYIPSFINRKHGSPVVYPHELLEPVLSETYGVIVYQEQVMQIAQELSGFTLGQADILRRAMGKKKKEEMEKLRANFWLGLPQMMWMRKLLKPPGTYSINLPTMGSINLTPQPMRWLVIKLLG